MALRIKAQQGGIDIDDGMYEVVCTGMAPDKLPNSKFGSGDVFRIKVNLTEVLNQDGEPIELSAVCNQVLSPKSTLWSWLVAFGISPELDAEYDLDILEGRYARALVERKRRDDGTVWSNITKFLPVVAGRQGIRHGLTSRPAPSAELRHVEDPQPESPPWTPTGEVTLAQWWQLGYDEGLTRDQMVEAAQTMFHEHPRDLAPADRQKVLRFLTGDIVDSPFLQFDGGAAPAGASAP